MLGAIRVLVIGPEDSVVVFRTIFVACFCLWVVGSCLYGDDCQDDQSVIPALFLLIH